MNVNFIENLRSTEVRVEAVSCEHWFWHKIMLISAWATYNVQCKTLKAQPLRLHSINHLIESKTKQRKKCNIWICNVSQTVCLVYGRLSHLSFRIAANVFKWTKWHSNIQNCNTTNRRYFSNKFLHRMMRIVYPPYPKTQNLKLKIQKWLSFHGTWRINLFR